MKSIALPMQNANWAQQGFDMIYGYTPYTNSPFRFLTYSLGENYQYFTQRLLMYLSFAGILILSTFLITGTIKGPVVFTRHLPFICTLALYTAAVFTIAHILADIGANQLKQFQMAYELRSVGHQWVVLCVGLILGFFIHTFTYPKLLLLCCPNTTVSLFTDLWVIPLWCASIYSNVLTVLIVQKPLLPKRTPVPSTRIKSKNTTFLDKIHISRPKRSTTTFQINGCRTELSLRAISHASVEDHYCRVFYQEGHELKNIFVRQGLGQLISQLNHPDFIRVHRSHMVNKQHIRGYKRDGRNHCLQIKFGSQVLPISRRQQRAVKAAVQK